MLKWIGAVLFVGCSSFLGMNRVLRSRQRVRSLNALLDGLSLMRSELETVSPSLPKLMELLAHSAPQPAAELFGNVSAQLRKRELPFAEVWERALCETEALLLRPEETQALLAAGSVLGKSDTEVQCRELERAQARLRLFLELEQGERMKQNRVYAAVGMGAGAMLAILLL